MDVQESKCQIQHQNKYLLYFFSIMNYFMSKLSSQQLISSANHLIPTLSSQFIISQIIMPTIAHYNFNLNRMEQQNESGRSTSRQSQKFNFNLQTVRHIGKRTGIDLKPVNTSNTYLRWSESPSHEDEFIARNDSSSSFSEIPRELDVTDMNQTSYRRSMLNATSKTEEESKEVKIVKNIPTSRVSERVVQTKKEVEAVSIASKQQPERRFSAVQCSPFTAPNVSSVKHRYSVGGRKSQEFLLELLRSQKNSKQSLEEQKKRESAQNDPPNTAILNIQTIEDHSKKSNLPQNRKQKRNQSKQTKQPNKPKQQQSKRQSQFNRGSKYMEIEEKPKAKRVTINDRGKIKLPTDSFSVQQIQHIVPTQFISHPPQQQKSEQEKQSRQNSLKRQRPEIIEEEQEQEEKVQNQPQTDLNINAKRNTQEQNKQPANGKPNKSKSKQSAKSRINISIRNSNTSQQEKNRLSSQNDKNKKQPKISNNPNNKNTKNTRIKSEFSGLEQARMKIRKVSQPTNENQTKNESQGTSQASRPQRVRNAPMKYYLNQKIAYNSRQQIINTTVSVQKFMQILGYDRAQLIQGNSIYYASNSLKYKIYLRPQQKLFTVGVDEQKLNEHLKPLSNFHSIWIKYASNSRKQVKVKVDHFPEKKLDDKIYIQKDQRVEITNDSDSKPCWIIIAIERSAKNDK